MHTCWPESVKTINRKTVVCSRHFHACLCPIAGSMAEQAIVHLQRILEATDKRKSSGPRSRQNSLALPCDTASSYSSPTSQAEAQYASISSTLHNGCNYTNGCSTPPPAKRHCNVSRSIYAALPTANADTSDSPFDTVTQCLECEVKDAEIQTLRRRIQLLKEQLASATSWSGERSLPPQVRKLAGEAKSMYSKKVYWYYTGCKPSFSLTLLPDLPFLLFKLLCIIVNMNGTSTNGEALEMRLPSHAFGCSSLLYF